MGENLIANARYTYLHEQKWPTEAIDTHHVMVPKRAAKGFVACVSALLVLAYALYLILLKDKSIVTIFWSLFLDALAVKLLLWKSIEKESVVVMPAFGVQLETHYARGKVIRRFVPIGKILKPVLLECVTPITCYWSLSLIVCGEAELMLVFKELRPPVKMLVPIWKALCAATNCKDSSTASAEDG